MSNTESDREFDDLLEHLCEDLLSESDWQRLVELLGQSESRRQRYLDYMELHASLWAGGAVRPLVPLPLPVVDTSLKPSAAPSSSVLGFLGGLWNVSAEGRSTRVFLCAAAVLFVGMFVTTIAMVTVFVRDVKSQGDQPHVAVEAPAAIVARVAAAHCQWVDPELALRDGATLVAGRRLELASGQVDIAFQSGAEVRLHGPAIFEIQSANSGFLTLGRLTARAATPESHGFTVHSRTAATVDLGTEFNVVASEDGHSQIHVVEGAVEVQLSNGRVQRRLGVGQSIEVEPGTPSVIARIEPGDCTPAFKFPTIEPPSAHDYADASQGNSHISVLRGQPHFDSAPVEVLLDGKGQSMPDSPEESFFFSLNTSGMILLDLGRTIPVKKVNTYSWHHRRDIPRDRTRATQKYFLYGSDRATPPGADGNLAAAGWTLITRVNTDEFFGFPRATARPEQQAVSITATNGGPIGEYRYLLWDVRPTRAGEVIGAYDNTFYGEFDVYGEGQ